MILFLFGLAVGVMNAVAGGGGLVGFPALISIGGLTAIAANATGYLVMLPGQLASAIGYRKFIRSVPKYYALLLIPCMTGAAIGSLILRHTTNQHFGDLVPWLILLAVGLFAFQPFLQAHIHRHLTRRIKHVRPLALIALILFLLSIYGGYFGPGFGFVLLAFLSFTRLNQLHQMNGLKNIAAVAMAATSIAILANANYIDWHAGIIMAAGSTIGGYAGAHFVQKVPSHLSRYIVIAIGIIAAAHLALRNY
ncbi:MAG TPA: sulfite exporter TauE/SafE family protein [Candidatus Saccharimonadales bacterium]|nr:sulfite exporter TauE/SafE family protein [Candidatus Saccharimonadales bacterium]